MTRLELLHLVVGRARANGFELRRWYTSRLELPWISTEAALALLDAQRRYYALIFSPEFAQSFWKPGSEITFDVPAQSFQRAMPDGTTQRIQRRAFVRRSIRPNAWRYHLREMALQEEPLRYLRKYLHIEEDASSASRGTEFGGVATGKEEKVRARKLPRPLPAEPPAFLARPYLGTPKQK